MLSDLITTHGIDRMRWVLAFSIAAHAEQFSERAQQWADSVVPEGYPMDEAQEWILHDHFAETAALAEVIARKYARMHLIEDEQCATKLGTEDLTGKLLVIDHCIFTDDCRNGYAQLFYVTSAPEGSDSVEGYHLSNGQRQSFPRRLFFGVADEQIGLIELLFSLVICCLFTFIICLRRGKHSGERLRGSDLVFAQEVVGFDHFLQVDDLHFLRIGRVFHGLNAGLNVDEQTDLRLRTMMCLRLGMWLQGVFFLRLRFEEVFNRFLFKTGSKSSCPDRFCLVWEMVTEAPATFPKFDAIGLQEFLSELIHVATVV